MRTRSDRNKMNKRKNKHILKILVLFTFFGFIVIMFSVNIALKLFTKLDNVSAETNIDKKNESINEYSSEYVGSENPKEDSYIDDSAETNIDKKNESINESSSKYVGSEHPKEHSYIDDVAFLEKYLYQQRMGQMPDGADGKKVAYLTFDDGPSETVTPKILDILKSENIKATFFILGSSVDSSEISKDILRRAVKEGHSIGNHTYSHNYNYLYPNRVINTENFMKDIEKTNQSVKNVLGEDFAMRAIRFPGGYMSWIDRDGITDILKNNGYYSIDWNSLSKDAEGGYKSAEQLVKEVKASILGREKAVILMHDNYGKEETATALPEIISYLKQQGYEFRTMK